MSKPILKPNSSWFTPTVSTNKRALITIINIVDSYTPTGSETDSWDASVAQDGGIMCYVEDTVLTIAGNGSGKIMANEDSAGVFCDLSGANDFFNIITAINGIDIFDTSNARTMRYMFNKAEALSTLDVSKFNTSKCENFQAMFQSCKSLTEVDVSKWDTSSCTNMGFMFWGCTGLTSIDFANWDVSKVTSFDHLLCKCTKLTDYDVSKWKVTSACTSLYAIFHSTKATTIDVSGWDTSNVITFGQVFESMTNLENVIGLETWDTSNGIDFTEMFSGCQNIKNLDLSNFDTRKANYGVQVSLNGGKSQCTYRMFYKAYRLEKVVLGENFTFAGDGTADSSWVGTLNTPSATYINGATGNWYASDGSIYAPKDVPNFTINTYYSRPIAVIKPNSSWFTPTESTVTRSIITEINIVDSYTPSDTVVDSWDASVAQNGCIMCYVEGTTLTIVGNGYGKIMANKDSGFMFSDSNRTDFFKLVTAINGIDLLDTIHTTDMNRMFMFMESLTGLDLTTFNTSKVTDFSMMFAYCYVITEILLSNWDTSACTSLYAMFFRCWILPNIDVSGFNTSNVTNLSYTFDECKKLEIIDVSNWDTSKVNTLSLTFQQCNVVKELDVSNWDVSNVTNMGFTFYNCDGLTTLAVENWDVSNVVSFDHTFAHCNNLVVDVSKWKTSPNCKYYCAMFHSNANTYLDVSGFDTSGAISMFSMFEANYKLKKIDGLDGFDTSNCHAFEEMFNNDYLLEELDLSSFDTRNADSDTPARSDGSSYKSQCTNGMIIGCRSLKKITLGENFTFAGDGTTTVANHISKLPTPSATYIDGADGNWYTYDGAAYAPADVPNLKACTYCATPAIAVWDVDSKKYMHLAAMRTYHDLHNAEIGAKLDILREEIRNIEEITSEDIQALFSVSV